MTTTEVPLRGPYDLREVALMGFGHRDESSFDGVMRLGFCVDGDYESQVGVALRQAGDVLAVTVEETAGPPVDPARIVAQAARVVSADQDGVLGLAGRRRGVPGEGLPVLHNVGGVRRRARVPARVSGRAALVVTRPLVRREAVAGCLVVGVRPPISPP